MLQLQSEVKKFCNYTRVVNRANNLILDNGSAPTILDKHLCENVRDPPRPLSFKYGGKSVGDNIQIGTNKDPLFPGQDEGTYNVLCVDKLSEKLGGAYGVIGLAPAGREECLAGDSGSYCGQESKEETYSYMNQQNMFRGFVYNNHVTEPMVPIRAKGPDKVFGKLAPGEKKKIVYTSTQRQQDKKVPFNVFQLGWPPEYTQMFKGKPCYHGAQFLGVDDLSHLAVDYEANTVTYALKDPDLMDRCD